MFRCRQTNNMFTFDGTHLKRVCPHRQLSDQRESPSLMNYLHDLELLCLHLCEGECRLSMHLCINLFIFQHVEAMEEQNPAHTVITWNTFCLSLEKLVFTQIILHQNTIFFKYRLIFGINSNI